MSRHAVWLRSLIAVSVLATLLAARVASPSADVIRLPTGPAVVPHTQHAAIYDLFGLDKANRKIIGTIQQHLSQEGYEVKLYRDSTEGAGGRGGGTLANFVKMAKTASVIVINTHGTDFGDTGEQPCVLGKGVGRIPRDGPDVVQICSPHRQEPVQQVEWYPTQAALHKAYERYVTVGGYKKQWLFESDPGQPASTLVKPRPGDLVPQRGISVGFRPWLGLTTSGIKHFFAGHKIDLIDNQACHSMSFAPSFGAKAYLGHASTACTTFEGKDEPLLFDRLTGHDNVHVRSVVDAFRLGGFADTFFRLSATQDVVLSPAVESASPTEGGGLAVGAANRSTLDFDAKMDTADPSSVVKIAGCGATISGASWNADGTELSYVINVPQDAVGAPATITVHAKAASGDGDNAELDGNEQPSDNADGGVEPNGDDYVIHVACHARTYPVMVDYTGMFQDDYTNPTSHISTHELLTWHETQTYRIRFPEGLPASQSDPATLTASGTLTTTGRSPDDNCTIAALPAGDVPMVLNTAQENPAGVTPTYVASFTAAMPTVTEGPNAALTVTGTPDNCLLDTRFGMHPTVSDPGSALQTARSGIIGTVNLESLMAAPLTVPFNVDYVVSDATGGSDHVVVRATATVSLTGPPTGI